MNISDSEILLRWICAALVVALCILAAMYDLERDLSDAADEAFIECDRLRTRNQELQVQVAQGNANWDDLHESLVLCEQERNAALNLAEDRQAIVDAAVTQLGAVVAELHEARRQIEGSEILQACAERGAAASRN